MNASFWATQLTENFPARDEAKAGLEFLKTQVDYLGGRICPPNLVRTAWMVQAFFEDAGPGAWLPDGCRRILIIPNVARQFAWDRRPAA